MPKAAQFANRQATRTEASSAAPARSARERVPAQGKMAGIQSPYGNQRMQKLLASRILQAKLTVNQPGDVFEREADRMADAVMRMPENGPTQPLSGPRRTTLGVQRVCKECEHELQRSPTQIQRTCCNGHSNVDPEGDANIQAKEIPGTAREIAAGPTGQIGVLRSSGNPLPDTERSFFEQRFGYDFGGVRIHAGRHAAESARQIHALAYTTGSNIVFGAGQYQPGNSSGRRLIAHELTHVVQQSGARGGNPTVSFGANNRTRGTTLRAHTAQTPQLSRIPLSVQRMGDPKQAPKSMSCRIANTSSSTPVLTNVMFDESSHALTPVATTELGAVAAEWNAVPLRRSRVRLDGYASTDGPQSFNWTLSCNRANAVALELESPSGGGPGIPNGFIDVFAQGETSEFSADLDPNRRVTVSASLPVPVIPATGCSHPGDARTLDVQPVFLRTGPADHAPTGTSWATRINEANRIWGKIGVTFHELSPVTLDTALKTTGGTPAERTAIRALRSGAGIEVFVVDNDVADQGGAFTTFGCGPDGKVVMTDHGSSATLLAHELGHTLGIDHPGEPVNPGDPNTVMEPTGSPSVPNLTRNTIVNYSKITCPPGNATTCLHPDP